MPLMVAILPVFLESLDLIVYGVCQTTDRAGILCLKSDAEKLGTGIGFNPRK